ncbi:hypothetical protein ACLMAJ_09370 [Nocardia sp. KC 131]|uniref:hypothetical protein n=1 Tax=Nocardia arseniciresistens TaxID=3392119 RepID=UPI00398ED505
MKRTSVIALAVGAVALLMAGCGGSDESTESNGLRKGSTGTSASASASAPAPTGAGTAGAPTTDSSAPTTPAKTVDPSLGPASQTTCADFKTLDSTAEKAVIAQILAENPDSSFAGSPNVALGTAKLVCLAPSDADTPVAVAAGIVQKAK